MVLNNKNTQLYSMNYQQAKYIIHGTVYCYFGKAFNKKSAKEQASAFAYLGFIKKTFKEFTGQDGRDFLLKVDYLF